MVESILFQYIVHAYTVQTTGQKTGALGGNVYARPVEVSCDGGGGGGVSFFLPQPLHVAAYCHLLSHPS